MRSLKSPEPAGRRDQSHDTRYQSECRRYKSQQAERAEIHPGLGRRMPGQTSQQSRCQNRDELLLCRTQRHPAPHPPRPGGEAEARDPFARHPASPAMSSYRVPTCPNTPLSSRAESPRSAAPHAVFPMGRPTGTSKRTLFWTNVDGKVVFYL